MNTVLHIPLTPSLPQQARLRALQQAFAEVCNVLAPVARDTRCWNRVALHHMTYRDLRTRFPQLGSQMICNAIYSVSRTCRLVYQSPRSPFNLARWGERPLPLIRFAPTSPVYFDRHTLSLKAGHLSMFTLDGRIRFELNLAAADEQRFHREKLLEVVLSSHDTGFALRFVFGSDAAGASAANTLTVEPSDGGATEFPEYVLVQPEAHALTTGDPA